ncbi:cyclase family protein [Maribacter polysiphoniae]|uniref:Cyclase family protein n=1 Tax=Maribacter polysiphoniae TaxID=429344 RepID=A0A316DZM0_9FLAO|nr:cyclase family protein [Maribacter polysiphoniae]MBD1259673.1 cyclase family protein [Maribacter polysiphoniae]PWK23186.1 kynurenine formamidase [Maribacter polysiphoniae]
MLATLKVNNRNHTIDLSNPLDISIAMSGNVSNVNAWYITHPRIEPHTEGKFIGAVSKGAAVNFNDIWFNPHAHGTHTECVGHITEEFHSINKNLNQYFFYAEVVTIAPEKSNDDFVISKKQLQYAFGNKKRDAIIIRTLPNLSDKCSRQYSKTNPPYLTEEAARFLVDKGVEHLLVDLPSVDKERDGGELLAHKAFWDFNGKIRKQATITEFVFVPNSIGDGTYFLNLQVAPFENDASPSRPVLYRNIEE